MQRSSRSTRRAWLGACAWIGLAALLPPWHAAQAAGAPDALVGSWLTDEGDSKVDIAAGKAADGSTVYAGKVTWLKTPARDGQPLRDAHNADPALRERPVMGLEILSGFKADAAGGWSGGTIYSPRTGKRYPAKLSLGADGRLQITVDAGLVKRTVVWTRG